MLDLYPPCRVVLPRFTRRSFARPRRRARAADQRHPRRASRRRHAHGTRRAGGRVVTLLRAQPAATTAWSRPKPPSAGALAVWALLQAADRAALQMAVEAKFVLMLQSATLVCVCAQRPVDQDMMQLVRRLTQ